MQANVPDKWEAEPPVETPDGWYGGHVEHTGGNIWCRIWRTVEDRTASDADEYYEVGYNGDFLGASLAKYVSDNDYGYVWDENIADKDAAEQTDEACAEAARELMEKFSE